MRLAVAFWEGIDMMRPDAGAARVLGVGVRGVVLVPGQEGWSEETIHHVREAFDSKGIFVAEVAQYRHSLIADSNPEVRKKGIEAVKKSLRDSQALNAYCTGVGKLAEGDWWSEKTWHLLIEGTREVAEEAEALKVNLAFHPSNQGPLDTPERLRQLLDEVDSPRIKVMLDIVNLITHRTYYDTTSFINYVFDLLGDAIIGAHAKDVYLDPSHWVLRIDEVPPGMGNLDYETFLRRMDRLNRDAVLIIEHLRDIGISGSASQQPRIVYYPGTDFENIRARRFIESVAERIGIRLC
jgi:sugar phosphate isomerase/epimerase